ncbi:MAG TPA: winged helix DNA-binding protein [Kineosporiaceae bacterium]|nr:winged helix DNA-binding protein [Kineosporiaceae bacterium]
MDGRGRNALRHGRRRAARHLDRAQSVVSDIVTHLEAKGLLERQSDPDDRRRTLVRLTPGGCGHLDRHREVLATTVLARALGVMARRDRAGTTRRPRRGDVGDGARR